MKSSTMNAIHWSGYGGPEVLKLEQVTLPTPTSNQILVKIHATSVTAASVAMRTGKPYFGRLFLGLLKPKTTIPGTDLAGEVVAVGKDVTRFKKGDYIMAETGINCGAYAEFICMDEDEIIEKISNNIPPEKATGMLDGASTALAFFTDSAQIKPGQKVLINGASGSIGTAAVQLAKLFGAEVTAVCSMRNHSLVKSLGADFVIDYNTTDFTMYDEKYDVIFDTVGKLSFGASKKSLVDDGVFLSPVLSLSTLGHMVLSSFGSKKLKFDATGMRDKELRQRDLTRLKELLESGQLQTVIDRTYSLSEIQQAHAYVDRGHKKGNVVIQMN